MEYTSSIEWAEAEDVRWGKAKVIAVMRDHSLNLDDAAMWDDFSHACQPLNIRRAAGVEPVFAAADVLRWLGY